MINLSESGTNRYELLYEFENTADGAEGMRGVVHFSAVGGALSVSRATPAATGSGVSADERHKYCFAAGTRVLLADGSS